MQAPDLTTYPFGYQESIKKKKEKDFLKLAFLSRILRIKNLDYALKVLKGVMGDIKFNIYGTKEDAIYWKECKKIIKNLPDNVEVKYFGQIPMIK